MTQEVLTFDDQLADHGVELRFDGGLAQFVALPAVGFGLRQDPRPLIFE